MRRNCKRLIGGLLVVALLVGLGVPRAEASHEASCDDNRFRDLVEMAQFTGGLSVLFGLVALGQCAMARLSHHGAGGSDVQPPKTTTPPPAFDSLGSPGQASIGN